MLQYIAPFHLYQKLEIRAGNDVRFELVSFQFKKSGIVVARLALIAILVDIMHFIVFCSYEHTNQHVHR